MDSAWISAGSGPWGALEYRRFYLRLPQCYTEAPLIGSSPVIWRVPKLSAKKLNELIAASSFTALEKSLWLRTCKVEDTTDGVIIYPSKDFRWVLLPRSRSILYNWLAGFSDNVAQNCAFLHSHANRDEWLQNCNLRPELIEAIQHLLYSSGSSARFSDLDLLDEYLSSSSERSELLSVMHRQPYCEVRLRLDNTSDLDAAEAYWGSWGQQERVQQLFEQGLETKNGTGLSLAKLMPAIPKNLLDTFPSLPCGKNEVRTNCFWTAFNFFNDQPDINLCEANYVMETVYNCYDEVAGPLHYGDIIFMTDEAGRPYHSAVYLAADFVFTKNGGHLTQPWVIMKLEDMEAAYPEAGYKVTGYRRKFQQKPFWREFTKST